MPLGRVAASQLDQPLLQVPFDLDLVRSGRLGLAVNRSQEAVGDKAVADARDRPEAGTQVRDDVVVGAVFPVGVGQEEDAGMRQLARRGLSGGYQLFQTNPFL